MVILWDLGLSPQSGGFVWGWLHYQLFLCLRLGGSSARGTHGCDSESHGEGLPSCLV